MQSPPTFAPTAASGAGGNQSGISASFSTGDFTVGGMKINWLVILAGVAVLYVLYKKQK